MSVDSGPELRVLEEGPEAQQAEGRDETPSAAASVPEPEEAEAEKKRPWLLFMLVAVVLILGIGYAVERGRASTLEGENAALQQELAQAVEQRDAARSGLRAAEARMDAVRGHVADIVSRMQLLQEAVAEGDDAVRAD